MLQAPDQPPVDLDRGPCKLSLDAGRVPGGRRPHPSRSRELQPPRQEALGAQLVSAAAWFHKQDDPRWHDTLAVTRELRLPPAALTTRVGVGQRILFRGLGVERSLRLAGARRAGAASLRRLGRRRLRSLRGRLRQVARRLR